MARGSSGVIDATPIVAEPSAVDDERRLVAAVRRGDDRAFERLYERYRRRIQAYVLGMVKDHGRAEDITQEVFVSALRRMRATERPIAFKPWIYEIAKNACIDQFRRSKRAEEVSLQAEDALAPADYGRLVGSHPAPDDAVVAKQELDNLCGAFVGLSDTHHEILILRELEGLSYREIGDRMGMSRPAVESTLFRARRRLTEEYNELVSGARCLRIQSLIAMAAESRLGARESRRLSRHVAYCQPCRREALAAGLDAAILTHVPLRKRAAAKLAGLLPFPVFERWLSAYSPAVSEQTAGGWGKLATAAAVIVAGIGAAGVGTHVVGGGGDDGPERAAGSRPAAATAPASKPARAKSKAVTAGAPAAASGDGKAGARKAKRHTAKRGGTVRRDGAAGATTPTAPTSASGGSGGSKSLAGGGGPALPTVSVPTAGDDALAPVTDTVDSTVNQVGNTVNQVGGTVDNTVNQVGSTVDSTVNQVGDTVDQVGTTVDQVGGTVDDATGGGLLGSP